MMKAVFLSYMPMTAKLEGMVPIDFLLSHGAETEFWDISYLFFPELRIEGVIERPYIRRFASRTEFEKGLADNRQALFILHFNASPDLLWVFEALKASGARTGYLSWGYLPTFEAHLWSRLRRTLLAKPWTTVRNQLAKVKGATGAASRFAVTYYAGTAGREKVPNSDAFVATNLPDYEYFMGLVRNRPMPEPTVRRPYALFLDCFLPFHPDLAVTGAAPPDPARYQFSMLRFFDEVERMIGGPVLVAAHPKANYPSAYYGPREINYGRTAELVLDSSVVLSHYSGSTCYAVLAGKPIIFAYTREMNSRRCDYTADYVRACAQELGAVCIDVDAADYDLGPLEVDQERYREFKYRYITSPEAEDRTNGEIVLSTLSDSASCWR